MTRGIRETIKFSGLKGDLRVRVTAKGDIQQFHTLQNLLLITSENYHVSDTLIYIQKNYTRPDISVQEISKEIGCQEDYLERLFKKEIGIVIHQYIVLLRIARFNKLYLQNQRIRLAALAEKAGFSPYKCFHHHITHIFGVKPQIYVKNLLKNSRKSEIDIKQSVLGIEKV